MWHKETLAAQENREIQIVGLIQEQHADRCRLFMQWKGMDWPVMVDSLNELQVAVVPITLLIDEYGIIRKKNPRRMSEFFDDFVTNDYMPPDEPSRAPPTVVPDLLEANGTVRDRPRFWALPRT